MMNTKIKELRKLLIKQKNLDIFLYMQQLNEAKTLEEIQEIEDKIRYPEYKKRVAELEKMYEDYDYYFTREAKRYFIEGLFEDFSIKPSKANLNYLDEQVTLYIEFREFLDECNALPDTIKILDELKKVLVTKYPYLTYEQQSLIKTQITDLIDEIINYTEVQDIIDQIMEYSAKEKKRLNAMNETDLEVYYLMELGNSFEIDEFYEADRTVSNILFMRKKTYLKRLREF